MDFRKVESKYQFQGLTAQVLLMVILLFSALRSVGINFMSSYEAPVQQSIVPWATNAGVWAICGEQSDSTPPLLIGAGAGMLKKTSMTSGNKKSSRTGVEVRKEWVKWVASSELECGIVNLTQWKIPGKPYHFFLCGSSSPHVVYLVWSNNRWHYVDHLVSNRYHLYRLVRKRYGFDSGYQKEMYDASQLFSMYEKTLEDTSHFCANMSWYGNTKGGQSILEISIEDDVFLEFATLGAIPQLLAALGSIGGSISMMTLIFLALFPKKYPDGDVAKDYETRTLRFAKGAKTEAESTESTAQPVAKQDVGAVRASRRLSGVPPLPKPPRPSQVGAKPLLPGPPGM
eukprot:Skav207189  [mRNA]  locus=scaffold4046:29340:30368:+ [translate_table: standard]